MILWLLIGAKTEEPKNAGDPLAQFQKGAVLMVCRTCGKKGQEMAKLVDGCSLVHLADAKQSYFLKCKF